MMNFGPVLTRPQVRWVGPEQPETMVYNVHFNYRPGSKLVTDQACSYCWATFTQKRTTQYHCSQACSKRDSAWSRWVERSRRATILGEACPAMPPAGAGLADAIAPFAQPELFAESA